MSISLTFEEAVKGVTKTLFINKKRKCVTC